MTRTACTDDDPYGISSAPASPSAGTDADRPVTSAQYPFTVRSSVYWRSTPHQHADERAAAQRGLSRKAQHRYAYHFRNLDSLHTSQARPATPQAHAWECVGIQLWFLWFLFRVHVHEGKPFAPTRRFFSHVNEVAHNASATDAMACIKAATLSSFSTSRAAASASTRLLHSTMSMKRRGSFASRCTVRFSFPSRQKCIHRCGRCGKVREVSLVHDVNDDLLHDHVDSDRRSTPSTPRIMNSL